MGHQIEVEHQEAEVVREGGEARGEEGENVGEGGEATRSTAAFIDGNAMLWLSKVGDHNGPRPHELRALDPCEESDFQRYAYVDFPSTRRYLTRESPQSILTPSSTFQHSDSHFTPFDLCSSDDVPSCMRSCSRM